MWNLPPPPGFQGLHPEKPLTVYQRHLPHWRQDGATYFVTYRLADSLPKAKLDELKSLKAEWERQHSAPRTAQESRPTQANAVMEERLRQVQERIERWLDQGMGSCVLQHGSLAALVTSSMHHFNDERFELDCYVVMPNHVHVLVRPMIPQVYPLEEILGSWKKYSSRRINSALHTTGDM
jgi:putative transposase